MNENIKKAKEAIRAQQVKEAYAEEAANQKGQKKEEDVVGIPNE